MFGNRERAREAAQELFRQLNDGTPVNLDEAAGLYDIDIRLQGLEDEISGMLVLHEDRVFIGVNANHHSNRRRFTIAHELGHFLLHREEARFFLDASPVFFRSDTGQARTPSQEREANAFAAELLMPETAVKKAIDEDPVDVFDDVAIRRLADRFDVSSQALLIRLTELDLVFA